MKRTGEPTVVVVDDDPGVLDSLVSMLRVAGHQPRGFSSASAYLDEALEIAAACVITDIRLPQIDGLDLMQRMRDMGLGDTPVIVISGHADVPIAVSAMQLGALTVLEKPFQPARLLEMVDQALASAPPVEDMADREAVAARYRSLSAREREVLGHLLQGSSSKMTAKALDISPRTVDVFRAKILKKMKAPNLAAVATQIARSGLTI